MAAKDTVLMTHPRLDYTKDKPVSTTRRSFERVWSKRGWEEHTPETAEPARKSTRKSTTQKKGTKR